MRLILLSAYALAFLSSPSIAASPYENAAKLDMEHLASSVLAASLCKGARFHGDAVIASLAAAMVLIGQKRAEDAFFSAIKANIDGMSANGREAWCSATIKAAKERNSEMLSEDNGAVEGKQQTHSPRAALLSSNRFSNPFSVAVMHPFDDQGRRRDYADIIVASPTNSERRTHVTDLF